MALIWTSVSPKERSDTSTLLTSERGIPWVSVTSPWPILPSRIQRCLPCLPRAAAPPCSGT